MLLNQVQRYIIFSNTSQKIWWKFSNPNQFLWKIGANPNQFLWKIGANPNQFWVKIVANPNQLWAKIVANPNQQWLGYRLKYRQNIDKKGHKKRRIAFSWEVLCGDRLCWVYSMLKEHDGSIDFKVKGSVLILVLMEHAQRVDLQKRSTIVYFTS